MEEEDLIQERLLSALKPSRFMQDLYQYPRLVNVFKDFEDFQNAVKDAIRTSLPDCYTNFTHLLLKDICLDIASKSGQTAFVKNLLRQGTKTNMVNKMYNRAPIHFATEGGHVDTLEALLAIPTNLNLQDTEHYQTALHIAVYRNYENCARLLLRKGASANIPNKEGLSAIYLAARNGQFNMVKLILKAHWQCLDLDNYWDQNNQTIREVIYHMNISKEQLMELQLMMQNLVPTRNYCDHVYYLTVSDETNFLNMRIDESLSSIVAELLEIATFNDLRQAVTRIINWIEKRLLEQTMLKEIVFPATIMALRSGRYVILQKLLKLIPEETENLIMISCERLLFVQRMHILFSAVPLFLVTVLNILFQDIYWYHRCTTCCSQISNWVECMKVMLNQEGMNIHILKDIADETTLYYAIMSGYDEVASLFLKQDCYIGYMNDFKVWLVASISEGTLSRYLDDCVQMWKEEQRYQRRSVIVFNYRCLMPSEIRRMRCNDLKNLQREVQVFMFMAHNSKLKHLLKHPLLSSFVYLKWCGVRYVVVLNFLLYLIFYAILNGYVFSMGIYSSLSKKEMPLDSETVNSTTYNLNITMDDSNSTIDEVNSSTQIQDYSLRIIIATLLLFLIFREILQFVSNCRYYVKEWTNGLQIMLFGLTVALLCGAGIQIGIAVTLLSTWELMIVISQFSPRFSTGIVILRTVFYNFIQLFAPYMIFILVFSMIFHVFYKESEDMVFSHPTYAIVKTMLMLIGDFGIDNTVFDSHYSIWSRLVLVIFVFLIVILIMNMLNALTVSNTAEILSQAVLIELIYRIELIDYFENIACMIDRLIIRYRLNIIYMKFYINLINRIFLFTNYLKDGKIMCIVYDTEDFRDDNYIINDRNFFVRKMDNDIIGQAKQIAFARSNLVSPDVIF